MAKGNTKIDYDVEEDMLYLSKGRASQASIEVGDFVIDIDSSGFVSAIEILNASNNLRIEPKILESFVNNAKVSMEITYKPNYIFISLIFVFKKEKESIISIPLTINLGHKKIQREEIVFA